MIHPDAIIGNGCFIQHHVTIGVNKGTTGAPRIGNNVFIGPYAIVLGNIQIGDNSVIGAGTIVMKNIEAGAIYTGSSPQGLFAITYIHNILQLPTFLLCKKHVRKNVYQKRLTRGE